MYFLLLYSGGCVTHTVKDCMNKILKLSDRSCLFLYLIEGEVAVRFGIGFYSLIESLVNRQ
jgi:hypothetical protein